jgi:hypothetical protein
MENISEINKEYSPIDRRIVSLLCSVIVITFYSKRDAFLLD